MDFGWIRADSIFTDDGPEIDDPLELKLDLFGIEGHVLSLSLPLHHSSQQVIMLLLSSPSDDFVLCDNFYALYVSEHIRLSSAAPQT